MKHLLALEPNVIQSPGSRRGRGVSSIPNLTGGYPDHLIPFFMKGDLHEPDLHEDPSWVVVCNQSKYLWAVLS